MEKAIPFRSTIARKRSQSHHITSHIEKLRAAFTPSHKCDFLVSRQNVSEAASKIPRMRCEPTRSQHWRRSIKEKEEFPNYTLLLRQHLSRLHKRPPSCTDHSTCSMLAIQPTYALTASIMQTRLVYEDTAVIVAIPTALAARAKKWFRSLHTELFDPRMDATRKGVRSLLIESKRERQAKSHRYIPIKDDIVMEYIWDKVELLRAAKRDISEEDLVEEIWMGLPDEIRFTFDNEKEILEEWTVQHLSDALIPKGRSYRATLRRETAKRSSFHRAGSFTVPSRCWTSFGRPQKVRLKV